MVYDDHGSIVRLDLSHLDLNLLPEGFFDSFTELKELNLSYNSFNKLPSGIFKGLTNLRVLDISYLLNPVDYDVDEPVTLPADLFENQRKLVSLDLSGNQLEILPEVIFSSLYSLERLDLSSNLLAILPPSIGTLVNLDFLILESNFLPMEFKNEYRGYMEVQEFLQPFQQEWMAVHESVLTPENEDSGKDQIETELERAFSMLDDLFD